MKIAVYHPWMYLRGGIERVLTELLTRSRHDWTLYTHRYDADATFPELRSLPVVELPTRVEVRRTFGPLVQGAVAMARTKLPDSHEALLVSSEGLGDLVTFRSRTPVACFCHTPLKIVFDPAARNALAQRNPRQAAAARLLSPAWGWTSRQAWKRYRFVFANSLETARRIERAKLRPSGPIEVLHPGVDLDIFGEEGTIRSEMFLVAGRIMWQKRIEFGIEAFRLAVADGLQGELVVAGAVDQKSQSYLEALREQAAGLPISFEPNCTDQRLVELYTSAAALVFTPPNEDWGIVPLEAMAAGTPVIASRSGGVRESVLHGRTGWLVDDQPEAVAKVMLEVARAPGLADVRQAARDRAREFDWDHFVARIDEVMGEVATS